MKSILFSRGKLSAFLSIVVIFVLCGFIVIAQDQEINPESSPTHETISDSAGSGEFYISLDDVALLPFIEENLNLTDNYSSIQEEITSVSEDTSSSSNEESFVDSNSLNTVENNLDSSDYDYVDLKDILEEYQKQQETTDVPSDIEQTESEEKEITYVLYEGNKKEIETLTVQGTGLVINVDENVIEEPDWKKEVTVSSNQHHENPVTAYSDIIEDESTKNINVYWKEEQRNLDYETFDTNDNGIVDRISWIVPHLSEQNFLITLDGNSTNATGQILISSPSFSSNITGSSVLLPFFVNSTIGSTVNCNLSLSKSGTIVNSSSFVSSTINYNFSVDNGSYSWNLSCADLANSLYNYSLGNFAVSINNTPKVAFTSAASQVLKSNALNFTINISANAGPIQYVVDWNDGSSLFNPGSISASSINVVLAHTYQTVGSFLPKLTVFIAGSSYEKTVSISVLSLSNIIDNSDPNIDLLTPENDEDVSQNPVNFSYFVSDNVLVANCTLSVYYYQNNNPLGVLIYSQLNKTINNRSTSVYLSDLSTGDYSWDVGCYDNSSNYDENNNDFHVTSSQVYATYKDDELNLSTSDQQILDDVNVLIDRINDFLSREDSYGPEEKEAIAALELDEKVNGYKKLLIQNRLDISYNLGFMKDLALRESRKTEIKNKLLEIEQLIPADISVSDDYDYYKTESKVDLAGLVNAILKMNGMSTADGTADSITDYTQNLQGNAVISNNAKHVRIDYDSSSDDITLVSKSLEIENSSFSYFIEKVPDDVAASDVVFITPSRSLGDQYFQVQTNDLSDGKIVYYIKNSMELNSVERTSTFLFSEDALTIKPLLGITGFVTSFSISDYGSIWPYLVGFLFVSALLFGGAYYTKQTGMVRMAEQHEGFKIVVDKLNSASRLVELKDFESAKNAYRTIKEKYSELPEDAKKMTYSKIQKLQLDLDRKEAIELVKEFITQVQQGRKDDARLIYNKIKSVYPRLPESDRKKGYDKIAPYLSLLNSR